jgi:crotonobetainyl-CoA:carnitine CoA-transferase CaiB-like acyl-CoA transferase
MTQIPQAPAGNGRLPLEGIRVADFSWIVAGPQATRIMANFGADVIRIERPDQHEAIRLAPMNPQGKVGPNLSGSFANLSADKRSITLNVRHPRGFDLLLRLLEKSDCVVENFSSRVLESWGLGYEELVKIKPDIIYLSMAGFGHSGRYRDYDTWGPTVQAVSGLTHLSGLPGEQPAGWGYSYMDHTGGYFGALALLFALHYRNRTGRGQWIDLSQVEGAVTLTGPHVLDYEVNGRRSRHPGYPPGNHAVHPKVAPHNAYRCAGKDGAGQDEWVAIACYTEAQWRSFVSVLGHPAWAKTPAFATNVDRLRNQDALDAHISAWTADQDKYAVMEVLQRARVPAGAVQTSQDRVETDPQLRTLELYSVLDHAELGPNRYEEPVVRLSRTPGKLRRPGPLFGEDNDYVYGTLLGLSDEEIAQLVAEGVI